MLSVDGFKGNSKRIIWIEEFRRYVNLLINQVPQMLFYIHDKNKMTNQILEESIKQYQSTGVYRS